MSKILFIEDSIDFQKMVKKILGHHEVSIISDPDLVTPLLSAQSFDLILLDISLPKRDGYSVLSELQSSAEYRHIPVICLTGKTSMSDKVTAFSLGADDYIQKPFDPIELRVRVDAKLQKTAKSKQQSEKISFGGIEIDCVSHKVSTIAGSEILLTQTEFKLLTHFIRHPQQVFSRENLLHSVWGDEGAVFDRAVDVHICSLRKKLADSGLIFKSVPGIGYRVVLANSVTKAS